MLPVQQITPKTVSAAELFDKVRGYTTELCEPLEPEDFIPQPTVDVSPAKWNIAHTTWFFEEMVLKNFVPGYKVFDPAFGFLFNSYYNTIGERTARDQRGDLSRPTVKKVFEYREYVDSAMRKLLAGPISSELEELVILGCHHEQQHQELFLTDLKYTFAQNPIFPVYKPGFETDGPSEHPPVEYIEHPAGVFEIGHEGSGFSFDNEHARHKVYLHEFSIASRPVTNAEYLEFIDAGGYRDHRLWHSEGWDWVNREQVDSPLYWHSRDDGWHQYTLGGSRKLLPNAAVSHVSFYEAAAFADWRGERLPTEFEWESSCGQFAWGERWEWTNSAYLPYPGFKKPAGAVGEYNGKFMVNQMVLRGASEITPAGHSRPTYRNFFHPHLRWQFTGIRLAR